MKKKMVLCLCMMMVLVAGCAPKVVCDFCGEEKAGQTTQVLGKEVDICNDCLETLQNGF